MIIHVGFPRTGTSSLQNYLFPKIKGVKYYNHKINNEFNYNLSLLNSSDPSLDDIEYLKSKFDKSYDMYSFERFIGAFEINFKDHTSLKKIIQKCFEQPKIIMTIRSQDSIVRSFYFIYLRRGGRNTLSEYIGFNSGEIKYYGAYVPKGEPEGMNAHFSPISLNYYNFYKSYCNTFGKENVLVLPLEMGVKDFKTYKQLLEKFTGGTIDLNTFPGKKGASSWYKSRVVRMARILNSFADVNENPLGILKRKKGRVNLLKLHKLFKKLGGSNIMTSEISDEIMSIHRENNRMLAEETGLNLQKYKYF